MPRPFNRTRSYLRDAEALGRLRTALSLESTLDPALVNSAYGQIDALVKVLVEISGQVSAVKNATTSE